MNGPRSLPFVLLFCAVNSSNKFTCAHFLTKETPASPLSPTIRDHHPCQAHAE